MRRKHLAELINYERREQSLSWVELAAIAGVARSSLVRGQVSGDIMRRLAKEMEIDEDEIREAYELDAADDIERRYLAWWGEP